MSLIEAARRCALLGALAIALGIALLYAPRADACGPDFPHRLLADRRGTVLGLVDGGFDWDVAHLVPAPEDTGGARFLVVEHEGEPRDARSAGGSAERELYDDGAVLFHAGDLSAARAAWQRLLQLPPAQRAHRSTWAAYMLGRTSSHEREAVKWFELTRTLASDRHSFHDALGLAVASYGEQARRALDAGHVAEAVRLYAQQAAHGSEIGRTSLLFVARDLVNSSSSATATETDDITLDRAARDPIVRKLLASYLYARRDEIDGAWDNQHVANVERVVRVLERRHTARADDGLDRLAAVAYRAGKWALAARIAAMADARAPLTSWVKAKLALRDGRLDEARALLAQASKGFDARDDWGSRSDPMMAGSYEAIAPRARVDGERAVLALERRDYAEALTLFLATDDRYWSDAAYIAERVMSVDELLAYVKAAPTSTTSALLRDLLARRLMRAGRNDEAIPFFSPGEARAAAERYRDELDALRAEGIDRFAQAEALWRASQVLRTHGLEIVGFELDPDWAIHGGNFDLGDWDWQDLDDNGQIDRPRGDIMVPGTAFASYDEQLRVASTVARPLARFHYRLTAAETAAKAADLLPPRSQAYAAVLCSAASYVVSRHPERADEYWQRYVANGAMVDFAGTFAYRCPEPDFASARARYDDDNTLRAPAEPPALRDLGALAGIALAAHALARLIARRVGRSRTRGAGLP